MLILRTFCRLFALILITSLLVCFWKCQPSLYRIETTKPYTNWAIAIKTGHQTLYDRLPHQHLTFIQPDMNILYISDIDGEFLGHRVHGVVPKDVLLPQLSSNSKYGWDIDAHKNLPGFKLLYETFPDNTWYIMIDDDTYLVPQNLESCLDKFDHRKDWYLGHMLGFSCRGSEGGTPTRFAHGGTGIIISRSALQKMLKFVDSCIPKYRECFGGDMRTALCLRDAGVEATMLETAHGDPPGIDLGIFIVRFWCALISQPGVILATIQRHFITRAYWICTRSTQRSPMTSGSITKSYSKRVSPLNMNI